MALIDDLEAQIRAQYPGEWDAGGFNQARALASLLSSQGITTLGPLALVEPTPQASWYNDDGSYAFDMGTTAPKQLSIGGKTLGFLGDYNNDGTYGSNASDFLKNGNMLGWSAQGHGNVAFNVVQGPNGLQIVPSWASSSNAANAQDAIKGAAFVAAAGTGMNELFGGGLGGAALGGGGEDALIGGGSSDSIASGLSSADRAALFGDAGYGSGLSGAPAAGVGGYWNGTDFSGTAPMAGSTNLGTPSGWNGTNFGGASGLGGKGSMDWLLGAAQVGTGLLNYFGAQKAADIQAGASQAGIDEIHRQFDTLQKLFAPFIQTGTKSLGAQADLAGLNGGAAQQAAIDAIKQSPAFTSALKQGEDSILANASATGGLRGGNTQAALAQFSPQLLAAAINDQYGRLGGLTTMGQNSAAGVGSAGMATGSNVAQLLQQQGAAQAGGALAGYRAGAGLVNNLYTNMRGGF